MSRFSQRQADYKSALAKLEEALSENIEDLSENAKQIIIDGVLHRFEFTFELAWKTIKDYLEYMGITEKTGSPRENIQQAFKQGIIDDGEIWIDIMLSRNELSHLYDERTSRKIYNNIKKKYIKEFKKLEEKFELIL
jgi:nucleotidyltransferase substrate binding protein (TIGR01987 family)